MSGPTLHTIDAKMVQLVAECRDKRLKDSQLVCDLRQRGHQWVRELIQTLRKELMDAYVDHKQISARLTRLEATVEELTELEDKMSRMSQLFLLMAKQYSFAKAMH